MKKKIIQGITLTTFFGLIIGFVTYRSGLIDNNLQSSPNGGNINLNANALAEPDSIIVYDTIYPTIMSSSKSFIATDPKPIITARKISNPKSRSNVHLGLPTEPNIMSSSKSAIIFKPIVTPPVENPTSTEKKINRINIGNDADSINIKQNAPIQIMGSSKSGQIFVPKTDTTKKR